jgi:hypothetical protein
MVEICSPVILLCGPKMSLKECSHSYMFKQVFKVRRFPYIFASFSEPRNFGQLVKICSLKRVFPFHCSLSHNSQLFILNGSPDGFGFCSPVWVDLGSQVFFKLFRGQ